MSCRDLIRLVRQCKTAQEERDVIAKEAAALRKAFKEQNSTYRHRNVAKLMFMHMLGYPTHFGQMETLKLIASNGFPEKRLGYLGLMILLDERQEVLMLVTNSLKNDLNSTNQYIVGLALTALGNIASAEMARDLAPEVERLLSSTNPYIRKKAALCARRVLRKVPDMIEVFVDRAAECLTDRNHAVILTGVTLMLEIAEAEPATVAIFRDQVPSLCRILRALLVGGFSAEYDVGGIADPFLQVKILRLLRILGHGSAEASDAMSDVLAQVATNTEGSKSSGNAILYECVRTIMAVESIGGLRVLAVNTLGRFLAHRDNNIRYIALKTLVQVVAVDAAAVQRHRATIVECVKDPDPSIRRSALELVYALVNEGNVRSLSGELLDYLQVCDPEFKPDLTAKICVLVQRFAPDKRWYIDCMVRVLSEAGHFVKEEPCRAFVISVLNAAQLHGYAARAVFKALRSQRETAAPSLIAVALWCIGEYGDAIVSGAGRLEGESSGGTASESELVDVITDALGRRDLPSACREYALTALAKLSTRLSGQSKRVQRILDEHSRAVELEEQTRSVEYSKLFEHPAIQGQILEHVPAMEETAYDATLDISESEVGDVASAANAAVDLAALLGLDVGAGADSKSATTAGRALASAGASSLVPASGRDASGVDALQDLLGGLALPSSGEGTGAAGTASAAARFVAYADEAVSITFAVTRGKAAQATDIVAEFVNKTGELITGFALQAAVPKFMTVKLDPPSASVLPPAGGAQVTQKMHVVNSMEGQKPLVMRLRMSYTHRGQNVVKQAEVGNFPVK